MTMEKTFDAAKAEARIYDAWESSGAFRAGANASRAETFSIMIPPPNVTGSLHMGHAFNNTLQDILVRWKRMQGYDTLWQPGTDHAGIATQMVTERSMKENGEPTRREMGREAFVNRVWQQKVESRGTIIGQLKRLGASCDWSREAFTMGGAKGDPDAGKGAPNFHDAVLKVFVDMYHKGQIYRGKRLVNWDPHFETAISDLEVENVEVDGHMWHFKYPLAGGETYTYVERDEDGNVTLTEERDYISIATTRPETMLGDGAVAVHPTDERYAPIVGKLCEIPVGPQEHRRLIPIITDEYPDKDFGSGAVKITGAHDFNDYGVATRNGIPLYALMDTKGHMRADGLPYADAAAQAQAIAEGGAAPTDATPINLVPEEYRGLDRFEARKLVIKDITDEGLAVMTTNDDGIAVPYVENKKIMQPFGDRSKVVIEPMLTDQWYVDTAKIVQPAIDAVKSGEIRLMPEQQKKVYFHWLENIEPWCISRQLWWGHQIPVWYDENGNEFCASSSVEAKHLAENFYKKHDPPQEYVVRIEGDSEGRYEDSDGRTRADPSSVLVGWKEEFKQGGQGTKMVFLSRDPDVLDTWFSSGLWPIGTLGWPEGTPELAKYFPTSVLITGFDIIFFWVARMIMMQKAVVNEIPFHTIYTHALVRDEHGKKMSKSTGNAIDPLEMIDEFGADAVRFTVTAMAAMGRDLKLSTDRIAGYRNFGTKLWNATSFAQHNECHPDPDFNPSTVTLSLNKWIVGEAAKAFDAYNSALDAYRFNDAANAAYIFVRGVLCDRYLEFTKPIFFSDDGAAIKETRATMAWIIDQSLTLLHPIMPFITEELWGTIADRDNMLIHQDWPELSTDLVDATADHEINWVISLIDSIRSVRVEVNVPAGAKIPILLQEMDAAGRTAWANNEALIMRMARIETLSDVADLPKGAVTIAVEGGVFALPLADIIDVSAERERLEKSLGKLDKDMGGLRGRLNNPKFVESAPKAVVAESRELMEQKEGEAAKLNAALERLAQLG